MWRTKIKLESFSAIFLVGGATLGAALDRGIDNVIKYYIKKDKDLFNEIREIEVIANHEQKVSD
jgi:hypothetical protein